jgi:hypothetical protein
LGSRLRSFQGEIFSLSMVARSLLKRPMLNAMSASAAAPANNAGDSSQSGAGSSRQ